MESGWRVPHRHRSAGAGKIKTRIYRLGGLERLAESIDAIGGEGLELIDGLTYFALLFG